MKVVYPDLDFDIMIKALKNNYNFPNAFDEVLEYR